ncbi:MAG: ATP synthase F1 subunit delta, partial [Syntrophomonadaceae bacterium]|nr:ATP synthase F1 subunit delta [Syntrophomonadaceae bacterium]
YQSELEGIVRTIVETPNLKEYFEHLLIPVKDKKEVAQKIFASGVSQATMNFLCLIIDKRRDAYLEVICESFVGMADEARGIRKAELFAAFEVPAAEVEQLAQKLSAASGKQVQLQLKVDPALLGGVKIRIGDQIIDSTVAKKLEMLKRELNQAKIS